MSSAMIGLIGVGVGVVLKSLFDVIQVHREERGQIRGVTRLLAGELASRASLLRYALDRDRLGLLDSADVEIPKLLTENEVLLARHLDPQELGAITIALSYHRTASRMGEWGAISDELRCQFAEMVHGMLVDAHDVISRRANVFPNSKVEPSIMRIVEEGERASVKGHSSQTLTHPD